MKNRVSNLLSLRHRIIILVAISLTVFSGLHLFEASAKTKNAEKSAAQNTTSSKIVYEALNGTFGTPQNRVVAASADGSGQITIGGGAFSVFDPCWSPDGTKIAYVSATFNLVAVDANGGTAVTITSSEGGAPRNPAWSAANKIAFERANQIWVVNSNGANLMQFPGITQPTPITPKWSPNGGKLAFVSGGDIWTINADGTNQQRLTTNGANEVDPAWSSDGTKIIFARVGTGLIVVNADGTNETPVTNNSQDIEPDWSSDGTTILFTRNTTYGGSPDGGIYVMNPDGTNQVRIIADTPGTSSNIRVNYNASWQPLALRRASASDFDGDGRTDISVFRPSNNAWYLLRSTAGMWVPVWGTSSDVLTPADYDGDLKTDVAVWRPAEGKYYILNSFDATVRIEEFGLSGDIPTGGDWDGDGKADPAVFRSGAQGVFYYRGSMGNPNGNITFIPWGTSGDKPVASDYDGDGKTDAAVYRGGEWYVRKSSDGQFLGVAFGISSDKAIPADYDGDGKTDIAVYRDGIWYQLRSTQGFAAFQFGISSDVPAPADYDGDGKADAAVYRDGVWWILNSQSSNAQAVAFGTTGDKPLPSAYVR